MGHARKEPRRELPGHEAKGAFSFPAWKHKLLGAYLISAQVFYAQIAASAATSAAAAEVRRCRFEIIAV